MHPQAVGIEHGVVHGPVQGQSGHQGNDPRNGKNGHRLPVPPGKDLTADGEGHRPGKVAEHGTESEAAQQDDVHPEAHHAHEACLVQTAFRTFEQFAESHGGKERKYGFDENDFLNLKLTIY